MSSLFFDVYLSKCCLENINLAKDFGNFYNFYLSIKWFVHYYTFKMINGNDCLYCTKILFSLFFIYLHPAIIFLQTFYVFTLHLCAPVDIRYYTVNKTKEEIHWHGAVASPFLNATIKTFAPFTVARVLFL